MELKALITFDLPGISEENRNVFYTTLNNFHWEKIENITTTWKVSYNDTVTRAYAIQSIRQRIQSAKEATGCTHRIKFAVQLDVEDVVVSFE
jgi:hypothetical protein